MTTAYCLKKPQATFFKTASLLLKLANCSTHGGEAWCARVLHHFHHNHNKKTFLYNYFFTPLTVPRIEMKLGTHACNIISTTITLFEQQIAPGNFLQNYF